MCGITGMVHWEQDLRKQEPLLRAMQQTHKLSKRNGDEALMALDAIAG